MKIYGSILSPFVRACLVTAHEVGLADKLTLVQTSVSPIEESAALAKLSPVAKIPVLETDHGHAIYDSRVIIEYLAHIAGNSTMIPDDGVKRFRILTLQSLAAGIADAAVALRYELAQRPASTQWPEFAERQRRRIFAGADDLESNWSSELSSSNAGSILAATCFCYIGFRHETVNWREGRPRLAAFVDAFAERPSMKAYPLS